MAKRIVICADGTWNRPEKNLKKDSATNILLLARAITPVDDKGVAQQVFYDWGLGSYHDEFTAGVTGKGIHKNIMDGYRYIVQNYSPGDELFLFGFSRGAYTVRSLCGLINNCGILKRPDARLIQQAFNHYKKSGAAHAPKGETSKAFRKAHAHLYKGRPLKEIKFLGLFDTVGALGIPWSFFSFLDPSDEFYDTKMGPNIRVVRHALALDEKRTDFQPTIIKQRERMDLRQVWFVGSHSDVGGGYPRDPKRHHALLSDIALAWMAEEATKAGLAVESHLTKRLTNDPLAKRHDSSSVKFRSWRDELRPLKWNKDEVVIHRSVKERWEQDQKYRPENLQDYIKKCRGWENVTVE